jgi:hypothetical protein
MNTANNNILATIVLWLFVIALGTAFGAGLYEHRIVVPGWLEQLPDGTAHWNAAAARADNSGRRFWAFVSTGPLTLLTLASLVFAFRSTGSSRGWWLAAALVILAERVFTFSYFIPTMVRLFAATDSPGAVATAARWSTLNFARHALVLAGWLTAMRALVLRG